MNRTKIYKIAGTALKLAIIIFAFGFIVFEILYKHKTTGVFDFVNTLFGNGNHLLLALAVVLIPLNWGLEVIKWRYLVKPLETISFSSAVNAVLSGITVSIFTPNRIGEYGGRVFVLSPGNRWQGVLLTIAGSISQLVVTILAGLTGLLFYYPYLALAPSLSKIVATGALIGLPLALLLYFRMSLVYPVFKKLGAGTKMLRYLKIFQTLGFQTLAVVLLFSFLRYFIFSFQFYLLFVWCGLQFGLMQSMMLTSVIFFFLTAIPTVALSEFGVRGTVAVFVIGMFGSSEYSLPVMYDMAAITAAFFLWVLNLALPAVAGSYSVLRLRFFN